MSSKPIDEEPPGIFLDGFGLEVQGYRHSKILDTAAAVYLEPDTKFRIRLANANDFMAMVTVSVDDVQIGTFLLNPFSKFDIERPLDRPLGFTFGSPPPPTAPTAAGAAAGQTADQAAAAEAAERARQRKLLMKEKTVVVANFKPQLNAKVVQLDVYAPHLSPGTCCHRVELLHDTPVHELFSRLRHHVGESILQPRCSLVHWTTAEVDSPVEDVIRHDMQMHMSNCKRRHDPVRKMSLVLLESVTVEVPCCGDAVSWELTTAPTIGDVLRQVRNKITGLEVCDLYFMSENNRYLCSTKWVKEHTFVLQLLHRDEINSDTGVLMLKVDNTPPPEVFVLYARLMSGPAYQLEASPDTTVRECRYQLEELGGPWGDDPQWMFGGTFLESGRCLADFRVTNRVSIDVIPRLFDACKYSGLQMRDPIAVEGEGKINTAQLIRKEELRAQKQAKGKGHGGNPNGKPRRGATVLKGRIQQQFIEVDPIETDVRFYVGLSVTILPKDLENMDVRAGSSPLVESPQDNKTGCSLS